MTSIPSAVAEYLQTRGVKGPWEVAGITQEGFEGAVVIPALAESQDLFATLASLARNPANFLSRFLILVVVNHRQDAPFADKTDNRQTLQTLTAGNPSLRSLRAGWVDAASPGLELPRKTGGVGLARKIGLDLALPFLDYRKSSPLLISLDADTLVRPDYLPALTRHFRGKEASAAVIPFCHQQGASEEQEDAIRRYELFLRSYVLGLDRSHSPYAFHTVGSAMACTASAYVRAGGMNTRAAGEDFYFLQHLLKIGGVDQLRGTVVYPSARASHRVPFGTGRSIFRLLAKEEGSVFFYQTECFRILKDWLELIAQNRDAAEDEIFKKSGRISSALSDFLNRIEFPLVWHRLQKNFRTPSALLAGFHGWFDGLKTMKLIHHLSDGPFPRQEPGEVIPALLKWAGLEATQGIPGQLALLREIQIGEEY